MDNDNRNICHEHTVYGQIINYYVIYTNLH